TLQRPVPDSSVRSYLNLNTPATFRRTGHGHYQLSGPFALLPPSPAEANGANGTQHSCREPPTPYQTPPEPAEPNPVFQLGRIKLFQNDCLDWLRHRDERSIHAVVT